MALHKSIGTGDIHIAHQWEYADAAARTGATGLEAADVHKLALQLDTQAFWLLTNHDPVTWQALGAGAVAFLDLTDTPASYSEQGGKRLAVTVGETGIEFVSIGQVEEAQRLVVSCLKDSVGTINPGQLVYLKGYNAGLDKPTVELAKADDAATMPAFGIAKDTITNGVPGDVVAVGRITDFDTSAFSAGNALFVSAATAGALVDAAPTGADNLVQKFAVVLRSHASSGALEVFGAGRSNALPNLAEGKIWKGNASGVPIASDFDHGDLTGRDDDDHTQYHNDTRGDARYYRENEHISSSAGAGDASKPIVLNGSGAVDPSMLPVYGTQRQYASDDDEDTTTSTSFVQKLRLATAVLPAGTYRIGWSAELGADVKVKDIEVRVQLDDTDTLGELYTAAANNNGYACFCGFEEVALTNAAHNIDVDYRAAEGGVTAAIRNVRISCYRVA